MLEKWVSIDQQLLFAALNMAFALIMGALIGSERQIRGRMAGLRTNALVSLGAAGFVTFAALFPDDINPTRVAAQVVSGIGFLGAGIIFRDGFNIQGINTAATLWCSAAVGMMAGAGYLPYAATMTGLIVFINLALRPIVRLVNTVRKSNPVRDRLFQVCLRCAASDEGEMRGLLMRCLNDNKLFLHEINLISGGETVQIVAQVHGEGSAERDIEKAVAFIAIDPRATGAQWHAADEDAP
ncbi:MgtC/SapB family protein [Roseobacter sp.]|uniref:MgtC/SapB family protein n=1 Tax=Roseobacter sp. TaxID=1907202 RepID=UPI003297BF90